MRIPSLRRRLGRRSPARWSGHVSVAVLVLAAWVVSAALASRADVGIGDVPEAASDAPVAELRVADPATTEPTPLATPHPLRPAGTPLPGPSEAAAATGGSEAGGRAGRAIGGSTGTERGSAGTAPTSGGTGGSTPAPAPSVGTASDVTATAGPAQTPVPTATPLVCTDPLLSPLPSACVEDPLP